MHREGTETLTAICMVTHRGRVLVAQSLGLIISRGQFVSGHVV